VFSVFGLWAALSIARLTRLVEPPESPPGQDLAPVFDFFRARIPLDAGYLLVQPGELNQGADTGAGPRLRYELYPRLYDAVRPSRDEAEVHQLMQTTGTRYIAVPDASQYAPTFWIRQPHDWLRRIDFDANAYLLELAY
jgi:hypothetical protein